MATPMRETDMSVSSDTFHKLPETTQSTRGLGWSEETPTEAATSLALCSSRKPC